VVEAANNHIRAPDAVPGTGPEPDVIE